MFGELSPEIHAPFVPVTNFWGILVQSKAPIELWRGENRETRPGREKTLRNTRTNNKANPLIGLG